MATVLWNSFSRGFFDSSVLRSSIWEEKDDIRMGSKYQCMENE